MKHTNEVIDIISLKQVADNRFQGSNYKTPWKRIFGGQVLGQSLYAAYQTVPKSRIAHSMHGYFILTGDINEPVFYEVDVIRDGGSFSTRRVRAIQNDQTIFIMAGSFQEQEQDGFEHQITMPNVLPPNVLQNDFEQIKPLKESNPNLYQRMSLAYSTAFEFRSVENLAEQVVKSNPPYRNVWFKTKSPIETDDIGLHHQLLAYASDYNLLTTSSLPHNNSVDPSLLFFASLDHALYIHRSFRIDEWLLYSTDSPSASNSRGFSRGNIFDQKGRLVASVVQEGLIRTFKK